MRHLAPALALAATACGGYGHVLNLEGDATQGEVLYLRYCVSCHGEGGLGVIGPSLVERVPLLTDEELLFTIEDGPGDMTAFAGQLTDQELADLLRYLTVEYR